MNERVLRIVEFNKIIEQLTENANSAPAKALCRDLKPMDNLPDIRLAQEETDAASVPTETSAIHLVLSP